MGTYGQAARSRSGSGSLKLPRNSSISPSSCIRLNSRESALRSQFKKAASSVRFMLVVKVSAPQRSRCSSNHIQMRPRRLLQQISSKRRSSAKYLSLMVSSQFCSSFKWALCSAAQGRSSASQGR